MGDLDLRHEIIYTKKTEEEFKTVLDNYVIEVKYKCHDLSYNTPKLITEFLFYMSTEEEGNHLYSALTEFEPELLKSLLKEDFSYTQILETKNTPEEREKVIKFLFSNSLDPETLNDLQHD